ncbi:MAG: RNA-binding protein, partial [Pseudomarimonas sp.]
LRRRNPRAKLICLDLQPYANTQVADRAGVLNIGGFSDAVFQVIASFVKHGKGGGHWVRAIEAVSL